MPLTIQSLVKELEDKLLEEMEEANKVQLMEKEKSIMLLNPLNKLLIEVVKEKAMTALSAKFELLYMMKNLNNCLYILKRMFQFWVVERTSIRAHFG